MQKCELYEIFGLYICWKKIPSDKLCLQVWGVHGSAICGEIFFNKQKFWLIATAAKLDEIGPLCFCCFCWCVSLLPRVLNWILCFMHFPLKMCREEVFFYGNNFVCFSGIWPPWRETERGSFFSAGRLHKCTFRNAWSHPLPGREMR